MLAAPSASKPEDMRLYIQRQADTIESLHAAAQKYRARLQSLDQELAVKQAEVESLRLLAAENATLREDNHMAHDRIRELETSASQLSQQSSLGAETQAQLGVKLQAYQRHNTFLQGEIASREKRMKALQEQIDVLREEVHNKERRITLLVEKLRQHNLDPNSVGICRIQIPEEQYAQLREKLATQETTVELLRERLETAQEDAVRREEVVDALVRENKALKNTISRLIAQINSSAAASIALAKGGAGEANDSSAGRSPLDSGAGGLDGSAAPSPTPPEVSKLQAYIARRKEKQAQQQQQKPAQST